MLLRIAVALCTILLIGDFAGARAIKLWTFEKLNSLADVVVVATVVSTEPIDELLEIQPRSTFDKTGVYSKLEMEGHVTTFKVKTVLKGKIPGDEAQLVHYEIGKNLVGKYQNGPDVAEFEKEEYEPENSGNTVKPRKRIATGRPQHYLLFLKVRKDGKFEPVTGQVDSAFSVMKLEPQFSALDE
jgi:hypothetical protein